MNTKQILSITKKYLRLRPELEPASAGTASIQIKEIVPAGKATPIVSMRNAFMCGLPRVSFAPAMDLKIHGLYIQDQKEQPGGLLMSDSPQELFQLHEFLSKAHGNVLIGGLGLGCATHLASLNDKVTSTLTVEINKDVLDLVARKGEIAQGDIFNVIKELKPGAFSTAYLDTWAGTGERFWISQVVPLRRLLRGKIAPEDVICWAEREMHGQILQNLFRAADTDQDQLIGHYRVFRRFIMEKRPTARLNAANALDLGKIHLVEAENMNNKEILGAAQLFLYKVGTDEWEGAFGSHWDEEISLARKIHKMS